MLDALHQLGIEFDATTFSSHSFGIGSATAAAKAGFDDFFIQTLERWKSNAFTAYIIQTVEDVAAVSAILSHANP